VWLNFESRAGNYLRIDTKGFYIFDNKWEGIPNFWKLKEIIFSSSDLSIESQTWCDGRLSNIFSPAWYDKYFVSLVLRPKDGGIYGKFLYQNVRQFTDAGKVEFLCAPDGRQAKAISMDLDPPKAKRLWREFNLSRVIQFLLQLDYLFWRPLPYYQPTSLFVQAKTYRGEPFFEHLLNFDEIPVEKNDELLRQVLKATIRVRCWPSEFLFQKQFPPIFVKDFWASKRRPLPARCFLYSNYGSTNYNAKELDFPYSICVFVNKSDLAINELVNNFDLAIPPQLKALFECLYRMPVDKDWINVLRGLKWI
jgi:hypothetical protein